MHARYDQHYLVSDEAADAIVAAAGVRAGGAVIEIGPGRGILTGRLLDAGARLTAVEVDRRLVAHLEGRFSSPSFSLLHADWLKLDLAGLPTPATVVSNLPYSVASPILRKLLDWPGWRSAVLMFQREVADRILAWPGTKAYGLLSLSVRIKADASLVRVVSADCFRPQPKVESAVVRLERLARPRLPEDVSERAFFAVVRAAFGQRRKMAAKAVAGNMGLPRAEVEAAFRASGVPPSVRAEDIGLESFIALARALRR
ncbi:MAG: 16S rRNA (adenine(1518)-N(6)/adenine(1519)-N(6))-dimethyltransferase RsmA [Elusimicrobiota bacterium]